MAVGSTAKVPVSAAILAQHPGLRFLCAPTTPYDDDEKPGFDRVLGVQLESKVTDLVRGGERIGFEEYLKRSSNRYAATLLMLASTVSRTSTQDRFVAEAGLRGRSLVPADQYGFGTTTGQSCAGVEPVTARPRFRFRFRDGAESQRQGDMLWLGGNVAAQLGTRSWLDRMHQLFDMPLLDPSSGGSPFDTRVWKLPGLEEDDLRNFVDVSPAREDFGLADIVNLRAQYLPIILGGGQARWTTVKLAQAYGRIVSYRDVPLTMLGGAPPPGDETRIKPLGAAARAALLRGMQQVVTGGTGAGLARHLDALNTAARDGSRYHIFAKTGTPSIARPARSAMNQLAHDLIEVGIIRRIAPETIGVERRRGESAEDALQRAYRNVFGSDPLAEGDVARILGWIAATNDVTARGGRNSLLRFSRDGSISLAPDAYKSLGDNELDEGGVLALVVTRTCGRDAGTPPNFETWRPDGAIAIAINVESRQDIDGRSGENPGIQFIRKHGLLAPDSPVIRALDQRSRLSGKCGD